MEFLDHLRRLVDAVLASHYPKKWKPKRYNIRPFTSLHTTHTKINSLRACLHGGGGPQIGDVTCGGSPPPIMQT